MTDPQEKKLNMDAEEKPKTSLPKPVVPRPGYSYNNGNSFKGAPGKTINNRQRPGRAAGRGR